MGGGVRELGGWKAGPFVDALLSICDISRQTQKKKETENIWMAEENVRKACSAKKCVYVHTYVHTSKQSRGSVGLVSERKLKW